MGADVIPSGLDPGNYAVGEILVKRILEAPVFRAVLEPSHRRQAVGAAVMALDDWPLDQRALLRWADDVGRLVDENNVAIPEVRL